MQEWLTEALVLDKEDSGELDSRVFFYTKELGKIIARATSARKITSKLNSHIEPLNLVKLRLVGERNFQIADALAVNKFPYQVLPLLSFIKEMTLEGEADERLWLAVKSNLATGKIDYKPLLTILGFDPQFASCLFCGRRPEYFETREMAFCCQSCLPASSLLSAYRL